MTTTEQQPDLHLAIDDPQPPAEQFWQRYSPHGEMPMSMAGSIALHALAIGGLAVVFWLLASWLFAPPKSVPVEPIRVEAGGGGDNRPVGAGVGSGTPTEDVPKAPQPTTPSTPPSPQVALNTVKPDDLLKLPVEPQPTTSEEGDPAPANFAKLTQIAGDKVASVPQPVAAPPAGGGRGPGDGGGTGGGRGTGVGTGRGTGNGPGDQSMGAEMDKRAKRQFRWTMAYPTALTAPQYIAQLRAMGGILAIPNHDGEMMQVTSLVPGRAKLEKGDPEKLKRLKWSPTDPQLIPSIMTALGLRIRPPMIHILMPEALEQKMVQLEEAAMKSQRRVYNEDAIERTFFEVRPAPGGGYVPILTRIEYKR
jgi:hypothetical protein